MPDLSQSTAHFGKYLLDQELARGGMSRVFRARLRGPAGFEKKLVVKQILPELARDPGFISLFVKEANTLVQMSHPSLVPVYELGVVDGVYFLAMEWVEGATISEILREGPLPEASVAHIGLQIAEALRYAHERFELVHRDVTPRNVIIDGAGHARLLDFGIAAKVAQTGLGGPDELFGSPGYMAPEQLRGEALGPDSDLYALGAVLHEAISGKPALPRTTAPSPEPVRVPRLGAIDATLADLIARMLEPERSARPGTAGEVASLLRRWLAEKHPQGVEHELSLRATRAHDAREAAPPQLADAPAPQAESSGPIEVRSIAQSPALDELLKQVTERIEREPISPALALQALPVLPAEDDAPLLADPEAHRTVRRYGRDLLVLSTALMATVWWTELHPRPQLPEGVGEETAGTAAPTPSAATAASTSVTKRAEPSAATPITPTQLAPPPTAAPEPSVATQPPTDSAAADKSAFVTLSAAPWATVRIDNHAGFVTPRRHLPLRPGKHILIFTCPPLGKEARVPLELHPAQSVQVLVDLHEDPPKITLK